MNLILLKTFLTILIVKSALSQRRITGGRRVKVDKPYMVYFVWDTDHNSEAPDLYKHDRDDNTICGGSIITPNYILTSAACMIVKPKQYVIAGYSKYVPQALDDADPCLKITRRRIILKYLNAFNYSTMAYYKMITWAKFYDYAAVKVDRPYDFNDRSYLTHCSYIPSPIKIRLEAEVPVGTHVVTFGWGSPKYQRPEGYNYNVNQKYLMGTSSVIIDSETCRDSYSRVGMEMNRLICTDGKGKLDFDGSILASRRDNSDYNNTSEDEMQYFMNIRNLTKNDTVMLFNIPHNLTRRNSGGGPCENDHGGPLVAWFNGVEYLVGITLGYLVNERLECVGPYIFTNIVPNFIACTTDWNTALKRRLGCGDTSQYRFNDMIEEDINWD